MLLTSGLQECRLYAHLSSQQGLVLNIFEDLSGLEDTILILLNCCYAGMKILTYLHHSYNSTPARGRWELVEL